MTAKFTRVKLTTKYPRTPRETYVRAVKLVPRRPVHFEAYPGVAVGLSSHSDVLKTAHVATDEDLK